MTAAIARASGLLFLTGICVCSLALSMSSHAATYNFYFNNSEQGDNSEAKPTVVVNEPDGKKTTVGPDGETFPATEGEEAIQSQPIDNAVPSAPQGQTRNSYRPEDIWDKWSDKFTFGVSLVSMRFTETRTERRSIFDDDYEFGAPDRVIKEHKQSGGLIITPGFQFNPYFGAHLILGHMAGAEVELNPIGIGNAFQLGLFGGISRQSSIFLLPIFGSSFRPHYGAHASFRVAKEWLIRASARQSPDWLGAEDSTLSFGAGIVYRL